LAVSRFAASSPTTGTPEGPSSCSELDVSFDEFYEMHFAFVWRNVRRMVATESFVDDLVQEVFLVALRRLPEFEGRSSIRTWLYGIVRLTVLGHRKTVARRRLRDSVDVDAIAATTGGPQHAVETDEGLATLRQILLRLDSDKRDVFILSELEEMTAPEIAAALGITVTTVYGRLRDARRAFEAMAQRIRLRQDQEKR
jgi:RNA polymerase sigma-70 factor (ECF subfamily)